MGKNIIVAGGTLANVVCETAAGTSDGSGQARYSTTWDFANEGADGLRLDESSKDGEEGSLGELHSDGVYGVSLITSVEWALVVSYCKMELVHVTR
jgi:hypothetical protein